MEYSEKDGTVDVLSRKELVTSIAEYYVVTTKALKFHVKYLNLVLCFLFGPTVLRFKLFKYLRIIKLNEIDMTRQMSNGWSYSRR